VTSAVSSQVGAPVGGRRRRRAAALTGLAVAVLVLVGGWLLYVDRPAEYKASSTLVVLPNGQLAETASYYDTLSQGQIVTTFAGILDLQAKQLGTAGDEQVREVTVEVVPDTSLIQITGTATDAASAEAVTDAVLEQSRASFDQLPFPYQVNIVQGAVGTAQPAGLVPGLLAGVVAAVALIAGIATYLAIRAVLPAQQPLRPASEGSDAPSDGLSAASRYRDGGRDERFGGGGVSATQPVRVGEAGPVAPQSAR
jgi:capsular polysaccharide biosynthesis protein